MFSFSFSYCALEKDDDNDHRHLLVVCLFFNMKKTCVNLEAILNMNIKYEYSFLLINITN